MGRKETLNLQYTNNWGDLRYKPSGFLGLSSPPFVFINVFFY